MKKLLLALAISLFTAPVLAEKAVFVELPGGKLVGVVYTANGNIVITDVQIIKLPNPSPPVPIIKAVRAMIVYETDNSTQELALLINRIRNNQQLSKKIPDILDQHTKNENREPDTEVQAALEFFKGGSLPRIIGFDVNGKPAIQESLLGTDGKVKTLEQVQAIVANWGL